MKTEIEFAFQGKFEDYLRQLVTAAQKLPPESRERRRCLTQLVRTIRQSGRLYRSYSYGQISSEAYEDALQTTFIYVLQNLDRYNPEHSFISWFNSHLRWRLIDVARTNMRQMEMVSLDMMSSADELAVQSEPSLSEELEAFIQEDTSRVFQGTHLSNHPKASFQYIALQRLNGSSWVEISDQLGIPIPTLSSFFQRCLRKFAPEIKRSLAAE
jgi:RNA polymerase sigma factor (sigma-70 family)